MRTRLGIALQAVLLLVAVSCGNVNQELERMVPDDATGVVCVDVPQILEKSGMINEGKLSFPAILKRAIDETDESFLSQTLADVAKSGIDIESKIYLFFANKTFSTVLLASVEDNEKMEKMLERRLDVKFTDYEGVQLIKKDGTVYAMRDGILLIAELGKDVESEKAAGIARSIMSHSQKSIFTDNQVKDYFSKGRAISAYLKHDGMMRMLKSATAAGKTVSKTSPLALFAESGIDAVKLEVDILEDEVTLTGDIVTDAKSDYSLLMKKVLTGAENSFLKAVPVSMKYVAVASVKGAEILELPQVQQLLKTVKREPYIGRLDFEGMIESIDGPIAVAASPDDTFEGDWNGVLVLKSRVPERIISYVSRFAAAMGQAPQIVKGEYLYEYNNKAITMGQKDDALYIKFLNYEQTEGYADENTKAKDFFAKSPLGIFAQLGKGSDAAIVTAGLESPVVLKAMFKPNDESSNPALLLIKTLCELKPMKKFSETGDDDAIDYTEDGAIDELHPVAL